MAKQAIVTIPREEYAVLKKKAALADDVLLQLDASLKAAVAGKIRKAIH